ncbi:hypothetical protein [Neptuniibacter halophilus]|uniref:hypothetical protein n=1 Tax=Neptuniibacter halophilus TaxID=651666 RepID=UPI0025723D10|nr:hypothetical protein [Neptuniibacter halophilus]
MLKIGTFTFNYDSVEDRILLVGNLHNESPRIDFWLTRKLVLRLLSAAPELIEKTSSEIADVPQQHRAQLAQFHHENARQTLQGMQEDGALVATTHDLLSRLDISHRDGMYRLTFFTGSDDPVAVSTLRYDELHQVLHLLHQGAKALDWGVAPALFESSQHSQTLQ